MRGLLRPVVLICVLVALLALIDIGVAGSDEDKPRRRPQNDPGQSDPSAAPSAAPTVAPSSTPAESPPAPTTAAPAATSTPAGPPPPTRPLSGPTIKPLTGHACEDEVRSKLYKLYLNNQAKYDECGSKSASNNSIPFDGFYTLAQLQQMSNTSTCVAICKGILLVVEKECDLGRLPVRSAAEVVLKVAEDQRQGTVELPPGDTELESMLLTRRNDMLRKQSANTTDGASAPPMSEISKQIEGQVAKCLEHDAIHVSPELIIMSALVPTTGGSESFDAGTVHPADPSQGENASEYTPAPSVTSEQQSIKTSIAQRGSRPSAMSATILLVSLMAQVMNP